MRSGNRKRERTGSLSPPLRSSYESGGTDAATFNPQIQVTASAVPSPVTFIGLTQYRLNHSNDARQQQAFIMRHNLMHMQALQEVLRRTSLAEMRDREVVEWLFGTERWLREFHQPLMLPGAAVNGIGEVSSSSIGVGAFSTSAFPPAVTSIGPGDAFTRAYSSALTEMRLLVIGVLHTMPWWRVLETVAKTHSAFSDYRNDGTGSGRGCGKDSSGGGGGGDSLQRCGSTRRAAISTAAVAADRALAAQHAITRWHVRLQVAFERVCIVLIEKSQHTVRGVLEVLLKPCRLRPPVRDGARRSIPSDSFIRVLNAVATLYSSSYVIDLLEGCIADFMPRRRWAERRHHVACTAVLLYVALEGQTPAYHPHLGNSQSLQRAIELLKSLRSPNGGGGDDNYALGGLPWRLPHATRSSSLTLGVATSEDSGTDVGGNGGSSSATSTLRDTQHHRHNRCRMHHTQPMIPSNGSVLPAGYVSAALFENARNGGRGLRQPALARPGDIAGFKISSINSLTTASDTELSDSAVMQRCCVWSESDARIGSRVTAAADVRNGGLGGGSDSSSSANTTSRRGRAQFNNDVGSGSGFIQSDLAGASIYNTTTVNAVGGAAAATSTVENAGVNVTAASLLDVSVEHNNKLLAYRNNIIRLLLNRLLEIEQTLEPCEEENQLAKVYGSMTSMGWMGHGSFRSGFGGGDGDSSSACLRNCLGSSFGSASLSGQSSPSSLIPISSAAARMNINMNNVVRDINSSSSNTLIPPSPVAAGSRPLSDATATATATSSVRSSPASVSLADMSSPASYFLSASHPSTHPHFSAPFGAGVNQPLEKYFSSLSLPYLRILRDCTTLVYGRLADDLRRQQVAGSCGNADWWEEILHFYLKVVTQVEHPVYLVYLAPSLAMLSTEDESVNLLHKLITLVTKGSMPMEQPRPTINCSSCGFNSSGTGSAFCRPPSVPSVQPVRLRMAPPTGGSRRVATMEERRRAARHIYPLFHFLHSRLDEASAEGVRRRLLKWTAQELRRLGGTDLSMPTANTISSSGNSTTTVSGSFGGKVYLRSRQTPSRESELALVTFAQCAAISELMEVDILPSAPVTTKSKRDAATGTESSNNGSFTTTSVSGDASDNIAAALRLLLDRYTLQTKQPKEPNDEASELQEGTKTENEDSEENSTARASSESAASTTSSVPPWEKQHQRRILKLRKEEQKSLDEAPRRHLDLRQMEFEGLLQPLLMASCPWQGWLQ